MTTRKKPAKRASSARKRISLPRGVTPEWAKLLRVGTPGYDPVAAMARLEGVFFDAGEAQARIDFFHELLKHVKGEKGGLPFLLEDWQQSIVANIFGWKTADLLRVIREALFYVPRKNGKTPFAAGLALCVLCMDDEPGIEAYSAASDMEQAALAYSHASGMVAQEPELAGRLKIYRTAQSITYEERFGAYKVLSSTPESKHGLNIHFALIDETHAHPNAELIDVLSTGTAGRRQPLILHTTTADYLRESICNEKYDYACKVRDGVIQDAAFLPVIYEAKPPKKETEQNALWWSDPKIWALANPNLGVSVKLDYLQRECAKAVATPRLRNTFKRLHLNVRTEQDTVWFGLELWDACQDAEFDTEALLGQLCYAGLDLASTSDLCALVLFFPEASNAVLPIFWLPEDTALERLERANVPYPTWVEQGFIRATPGNVADYDRIRADIVELGEIYHIKELALDRWNSTQLQTQLGGDGFEIVPFGQGFASMSAPSKELERLIMSQSLRHDGNPVLRWNASNVAVETDAAGNLKPSKKKSTEKIDGIVSLIMAIGRAIVSEPEKPSVYESRGIRRL